jgi:hypothetical protein
MPSTKQLQAVLAACWLRDYQVEQKYSLPKGLLARMRYKRKGPKFRRVSYKLILYCDRDVEAWLEAQPAGGDSRMRRTATAAKSIGAKNRINKIRLKHYGTTASTTARSCKATPDDER